MRIFSLVLLGLSLFGCGTTCPEVKTTRCNGTVVELCGANKKWQRVMDCAQVKPIKPGAPAVWTCTKTTTGTCTCMPGGAK